CIPWHRLRRRQHAAHGGIGGHGGKWCAAALTPRRLCHDEVRGFARLDAARGAIGMATSTHLPPPVMIGSTELLRWGAHGPSNSKDSASVRSSDESAALRDRLLGEIAGLQSQESTTTWAQGALAAKNRLTAEDAKVLEEAFEKRLSKLLPSESAEVANIDLPE